MFVSRRKSQSLRNQGFIRTMGARMQARKGAVSIPSKSGFHSNLGAASSGALVTSLNPFEIRVSFEPSTSRG